MQILVPRSGSVLFYNMSLIRSRTPSISSSFVAYFRSTPTSFEKWKSKWKNSLELGRPKPAKTYIKYKTRQKRADAKKALNDLLFRSGSSKFTLEGEFLKRQGTKRWDGDPADPADDWKKRDPLKSSGRRASKSHQKRNRSKSKIGNNFEEFDDDPGSNFQATFGNRSYFWSFKTWEESFLQSQTSGFEWREESNGTNSRNKWRTASDDESDDDESYDVGSHSDRLTLGLPTTGSLKIDEVKNAFRLSALKWHPDRHQGPSQTTPVSSYQVPTKHSIHQHSTIRSNQALHTPTLNHTAPNQAQKTTKPYYSSTKLCTKITLHQTTSVSTNNQQPSSYNPSQVLAEEKFKLCVSAYKSLCSALSRV